MRQESARQITEALRQNGKYKLFFVVTQDTGRVRAEDVATINLVLKRFNIKSIMVSSSIKSLYNSKKC